MLVGDIPSEKLAPPSPDSDYEKPPPSPSLLSDATTLAPGSGDRTLVLHTKSLGVKFALRDEATGRDVYSGRMPMFKRKAPGIQLHAGADTSGPAVAAVRRLWHCTPELGLGDAAHPDAMTWTAARTVSTWDPKLTYEAEIAGHRRQLVWERGPYGATERGEKKGAHGGLPAMLRYTLTDAATGETFARSTILDKWSMTRGGAIRFFRDDLGAGAERLALMSWLVAMTWVCAMPGMLQAETAAAGVEAYRERRAGGRAEKAARQAAGKADRQARGTDAGAVAEEDPDLAKELPVFSGARRTHN